MTSSETDLQLESGYSLPDISPHEHAGAVTIRPAARIWPRLVLPTVLVVVLALGPNVLNSYFSFLVNLAIIYALMTVSFDLLLGWSGQMGLAQAGLVGLGAYSVMLMTEHGVPYIVSLVLAAILAAIVSVIIGFPAIRLKGFFLAIATLAFGLVIVRVLAGASSLTGGGGGISVPTWTLPGGYTAGASIYWLSLAVTTLTFFGLWRLLRGRFGRTLLAVKNIPHAAESLGVPVLRYRLYAFALSGAIAAVAGGLFAQLQTYIFPDMFDTRFLVLMLIMVIVGGSVSMWGPVFGAAFAVGIVQLQQSLGSYQNLAYGLTLMAAIGILPGGIVSLWGKSLTLLRKLLALRAERTAGTADAAGTAGLADTAGTARPGERADAAVAAATPPAG